MTLSASAGAFSYPQAYAAGRFIRSKGDGVANFPLRNDQMQLSSTHAHKSVHSHAAAAQAGR